MGPIKPGALGTTDAASFAVETFAGAGNLPVPITLERGDTANHAEALGPLVGRTSKWAGRTRLRAASSPATSPHQAPGVGVPPDDVASPMASGRQRPPRVRRGSVREPAIPAELPPLM
jgi:hypothetical protein